MCCDIVDWQERMHYIDDALGMCAGLSSFPLKPPYHIHNYPKFISAGAGIDMDEDKLTRPPSDTGHWSGPTISRRGMRRKDEKPPKNHWKKRFPELEKNSWTPTTNSRDGTTREFPPRNLYTNWAGLRGRRFRKKGDLFNDNGDTPSKRPRRTKRRRCSRDG
jgi:hypothetical protein